MQAVFIREGLTVENVTISAADHPVMYRSASVGGASQASPIMLGSHDVQAYFRRPSMFDGRPVYALETIDVKEVVLADFFRASVDLNEADDQNRTNVWLVIEKNTKEAVQLDEWTGELPWSQEDKQNGLIRPSIIKRGIKLLVMREREPAKKH